MNVSRHNPFSIFFLKYVVLCFLLLFVLQGNAQQYISAESSRRPLTDVLEEVSLNSGTRFAYDADSFRKIQTTIAVENTTLEQLLALLNEQHHIDFRLVDGTWLLILGDPLLKAPVPEPKPQFVDFYGYVRDRQTGENLVYCNIVTRANHGGMTNEMGFFNIRVPEADSVQILVSHLGYQRLDTIVSVKEQVTFFLKPSAVMMDVVKVVHRESKVLQAAPGSEKIAFNPLKASAVPRIANDDLGNALLLIPGVEFFQGGSSGLSIRGGEPTDNLVLFDGIPVLETSHLLGNMSVLNAKFVQQAFVSRGGFDAGYGGRVSGLIELIGKTGKMKNPYLDISANLLNTNILASVPVTDKFSITGAWRRSFIDRWQNYLYFRLIDDVASSESNPVTSTIIPTVKFQDVNLKISFHPAENFELNLNMLYGNDYQARDFELLQTRDYYRNESLQSRNLGLSLNSSWQKNPRWLHSFSIGFSNLEKTGTDETGELETYTETVVEPGKGQGKGKGVAKTREVTYIRETHDIDNLFNQVEELRAAWKTQYKAGIFATEAGAGWTFNRYTYDFFASRLYDALQIDSISNSSDLMLLNGFVQQNIDVTDYLRLRWGMRTNYDPLHSRMYWQPRGGITFTPQEDLSIYFLSGIYYQFLSGIRRFDSEGHVSRLWFLPGEEGTGVVSGEHYIVGSKYSGNGWFIDLEGYLKNARGKLNLFGQNTGQGDSQIVSYAFRESEERKKGIDLFVQKRHSIFEHMAGYSLSSTEEKMEGVFGNGWFPGYNDRTHRLKLTEMINWNNWTFTAAWQFGSGLPVYRYIADVETERFERSGYYSQFNVALMKTFQGNYFSFSAGASLLNVLDRSNVVEVNYLRFSSDSGSMTVRSDISALGTTPVFFINLKF